MKQIVLGIIIIMMAFSLHSPVLVILQVIAGAVLLTVGILKIEKETK